MALSVGHSEVDDRSLSRDGMSATRVKQDDENTVHRYSTRQQEEPHLDQYSKSLGQRSMKYNFNNDFE